MARRREFCFSDTGFVGGILRVGARGFAVTLPLVPPLDEVAALGMGFVVSIEPDAIASSQALAVEENGCKLPLTTVLDLLEELDAGQLRHGAAPWKNRQ